MSLTIDSTIVNNFISILASRLLLEIQLENLALDSEYVKSLKYEGSATSFSTAKCMDSYLHSKERSHVSFTKNRHRSYGCREEHRITMAVMDEVCEHWRHWEQDSASAPSRDRPLPYYIVPSSEIFDFLRAQVNKYCFFFEMRFEKVTDLLHFLFLWDDQQPRSGWAHKPYRVILQKSFHMLEQRLGRPAADQWLREFLTWFG